MKIVQFTAENVKRLKAVEITPEGNIVVIAGRNAQGKTSVLDAIWYALAGAAATKETPRPIRDGEDEAVVELDMGDFTVTRRWKGDKTTLSVMSKDGMKPSTPQKFLDEKLGALSFDPLAFSQQDEKTQLKTLLELVELPFDPEILAARRATLYDERTDVGREIRAYEGQMAGLREVPEGTPDEEVSTTAILAELEDHRAAERAAVLSQENVAEAEQELERAQERQSRLEAEYLAAQSARDEALVGLTRAQNEVLVAPETRDFRTELEKVEEVNIAVRTKRARLAVEENLAEAKARQKDMTDALAAIDKEKYDAMSAAEMPVAGLDFDDEGVTFHGIPFKQCSSAERLRVSMAMAMAMNPTIRVIRISDGSLLDSENMAVIAEMAEEHDFQCWIERVDETGEIGFVIEDGAVKPKPEPKKRGSGEEHLTGDELAAKGLDKG